MKRLTGSAVAARRKIAPPRKLVRLLLASALVIGSAVALAEGSNEAAGQTETSISARWTQRKLHFVFMGFTTHYSCDGLRDQLKSILQQLGARKDLVLKHTGCTRLEGPEPFPGVDATFSVLEPAGAGGQADGQGADKGVPARWEKVTLESDVPHRSNDGQCELIEQVKKSVLPLFTTRNLDYSSDCFPHTESLAGARVSVEVLRPVKSPSPGSTTAP